MQDYIIEKNNEILAQFNTPTIRRRLKNELDKMYPNYAQIDVEINDKGRPQVTVYEIDKDEKLQKYGFTITKHYPFAPPTIFFQSKSYMEFLRVDYRERDILKRVTGHNCLCCQSLNCGDNWSPAITLEKIIAEIRHVKKQKRTIIHKMLADIIKRKYLIDDIDLDSWLF